MIELRHIFPLWKFYDADEMPLPEIEPIAPDEMPEPQRSLLVHERDMTSTLERFHGERIHIEAVRSSDSGDTHSRLVILSLDESGKRVEFGAIVIYLDAFLAHGRELILQRRRPLGAILADEKVNYVSCPRAFFRVEPDALICQSLQLEAPQTLYGRCNCISQREGKILAEIVEILPPS
jgi:hypothetical protein